MTLLIVHDLNKFGIGTGQFSRDARLFGGLMTYACAAQRLGLFDKVSAAASPVTASVPSTSAPSISLRDLKSVSRLRYHPRDLKLTLSKPVGDKLQNEMDLAQAHLQQQQNQTKEFVQASQKAPLREFPIESETIRWPRWTHIGVAHAQGRRASMEDAHIATTCISETHGKPFTYDLYGIVDGHGGSETANFIAGHLKKEIENAITKHGASDEAIFKALKEAFVRLDARAKLEVPGHSGAVVIVTLKIGNSLWTANLGDSRAVLTIDRDTVQLSVDAKPEIPRFKKSVEKRGGVVDNRGNVWDVARVNGILAIPRAIKDDSSELLGTPVKGVQYYAISPRPKITKVELDPSKTHRLTLACDGIWDVASSSDVAAVTREPLSLKEMAHNIVNGALHRGSTDNCSVLVVKIS